MKHLLLAVITIGLLTGNISVNAQKLKGDDKKQFNQAVKLHEKQNYSQALDLFDALLKKHPYNTDILMNKGSCQKYLKKYDDAISTYQLLIDVLDEKISDLEYSTSRKDEKKIDLLEDQKTSVKNKLEACKGLSKDIGQSKQGGTIKPASANVADENKNSSDKDEQNPVDDEQGKSEEHRPTKEKPKPLPNPKAPPFSFQKINLTQGEFITGYFGLQSVNKEKQIAEIQHYIEKVFDTLDSRKGADGLSSLFNYSYEDIMGTNYEWLHNNSLMQYEWFEKLKEKESRYRVIQDKYDSIVNQREELRNELKMLQQDSATLAQRIENNKKDSIRLVNSRDVVLNEELKSKLSTIPQSIVLVGRIKLIEDALTPAERNKLLVNNMTQVAIKDINAYKIITYRFSSNTETSNNELKQLYQLSNEGLAQTADKYYKTLIRPFARDVYLYEIIRIEVFPFNVMDNEGHLDKHKTTKSGEEFALGSSLTDSDINVYRLQPETNGNFRLIELLIDEMTANEGKTTSVKEHNFENEVIAYIKRITTVSEEFNERYNKKIEFTILKNKEERKKLTKKLQENASLSVRFQVKAAKLASDINKLQKKYDELGEQRINILHDDYKKAKDDYESFYQKKYQSVNQLVVQSGQQLTKGYKAGFKTLASECYKQVHENIQKTYSRTIIYKEITEGGQTLKLVDEQVEYTPTVDSFQVLSMIQYLKNTDYLIALNLAFKVKWQLSDSCDIMPEPKTSKQTQIAQSTSVNQAGGFTKPNPVENNKGSGSSTFGKTWKLYKAELSSIREFLTDKSVTKNWRLPDLSELNIVLSNQENCMALKSEINTDSFFIKYQQDPVFPSRESEWNDDNMIMHKGLSLSFDQPGVNPEEVMEGSMVYIIMLKK